MFFTPERRLHFDLFKKLILRFRISILSNLFIFYIFRPICRILKISKLPYAPIDTVLWTTFRCNQNCSFCHYKTDLNPSNHEQYELTLSRFLNIINNPIVSKSARICLYGGEPLLNADIFKIIQAGKQRGHIISLSTNGLLFPLHLDNILNNSPDFISLSYILQKSEEIAETVKTISDNITIKLNFILSNNRIEHLPKALAFAKKCSIKYVVLENMYPSSEIEDAPLKNNDERYLQLRDELSQKYKGEFVIFWPSLSQFNDIQNKKPQCMFPWNTLFLNSHGMITPCCITHLENFFGNIFTNNHLWNSDPLGDLRKKLLNKQIPHGCQMCNGLYDNPLTP